MTNDRDDNVIFIHNYYNEFLYVDFKNYPRSLARFYK